MSVSSSYTQRCRLACELLPTGSLAAGGQFARSRLHSKFNVIDAIIHNITSDLYSSRIVIAIVFEVFPLHKSLGGGVVVVVGGQMCHMSVSAHPHKVACAHTKTVIRIEPIIALVQEFVQFRNT